jgi:hypothetical protein
VFVGGFASVLFYDRTLRKEDKRMERLAALGFGELASYLRARRVEQGWPIERIAAELRVHRRWLRTKLNALELP